MRHLWKSLIIIGLLTVLMGCALFQKDEQPRDSGIIYGPGFAISLAAPEGWQLREQEAQQRNLFAVILPEGKSWDKAQRRMYASIARIDSSQKKGLKHLMHRDSVYFTELSKDVVVTTLDTIKRPNDRIVLIRKITGVPEEPYKVTAYTDEKAMVVMVGFGAQSSKAFNETLPEFYTLLGSYRFFDRNSKVIVPDELNE